MDHPKSRATRNAPKPPIPSLRHENHKARPRLGWGQWIGHLWLGARYSFWLRPTAIVLIAIGLAAGLVQVDAALDLQRKALTNGPWGILSPGGAEGARSLLQTIAGAMITVAGVVFSITLVALSLAASQYTPRVLRNFMGDRVNQTVLGAFVGIYAYCLIVLRTIRGPDGDDFVPALAVLGGLGLGLAGMAVLIYFIHHTARSIQVSHILAAVAQESLRAVPCIDDVEPAGNAQPSIEGTSSPESQRDRVGCTHSDDDHGHWHTLTADEAGYVQLVDLSELHSLAQAFEVEICLHVSSGSFVAPGDPMAIWRCSDRRSKTRRPLPPEDLLQRADALRCVFTIGDQRTVEQDIAFGLRQIVDLALRALSPGINDTTTAVMCVHRLRQIICHLAGPALPSPWRGESCGASVKRCEPDFAALLGLACDQIRQNAGGNVAVLHELLTLLEAVWCRTSDKLARGAVRRAARQLRRTCKRTVPDPDERTQLSRRAAALLRDRPG